MATNDKFNDLLKLSPEARAAAVESVRRGCEQEILDNLKVIERGLGSTSETEAIRQQLGTMRELHRIELAMPPVDPVVVGEVLAASLPISSDGTYRLDLDRENRSGEFTPRGEEALARQFTWMVHDDPNDPRPYRFEIEAVQGEYLPPQVVELINAQMPEGVFISTAFTQVEDHPDFKGDAKAGRYGSLVVARYAEGDKRVLALLQDAGYQREPDELVEEFINRAAQQDYEDGAWQGAIFDDLFLALQTPEAQEMYRLQHEGQRIHNHAQAEALLGDGYRIFAFHEQDQQPMAVTSVEQLRGYTPDQLLALRADLTPTHAPEQSAAAPTDDVPLTAEALSALSMGASVVFTDGVIGESFRVVGSSRATEEALVATLEQRGTLHAWSEYGVPVEMTSDGDDGIEARPLAAGPLRTTLAVAWVDAVPRLVTTDPDSDVWREVGTGDLVHDDQVLKVENFDIVRHAGYGLLDKAAQFEAKRLSQDERAALAIFTEDHKLDLPIALTLLQRLQDMSAQSQMVATDRSRPATRAETQGNLLRLADDLLGDTALSVSKSPDGSYAILGGHGICGIPDSPRSKNLARLDALKQPVVPANLKIEFERDLELWAEDRATQLAIEEGILRRAADALFTLGIPMGYDSAYPLRDPNNREVGTISVVRDAGLVRGTPGVNVSIPIHLEAEALKPSGSLTTALCERIHSFAEQYFQHGGNPPASQHVRMYRAPEGRDLSSRRGPQRPEPDNSPSMG